MGFAAWTKAGLLRCRFADESGPPALLSDLGVLCIDQSFTTRACSREVTSPPPTWLSQSVCKDGCRLHGEDKFAIVVCKAAPIGDDVKDSQLKRLKRDYIYSLSLESVHGDHSGLPG